jgi:type I phosphodiesterase/nucleotide pyrophosphatase
MEIGPDQGRDGEGRVLPGLRRRALLCFAGLLVIACQWMPNGLTKPARVVAEAAGRVTATASAIPSPSTGGASVPRYVVLLVLDGARPDYFKTPGIPHVTALMKSGTVYKNAFTGILESETPAGHAAISSGSQPRDDGILGFTWADNQGKKVTIFDPTLVRQGVLEQLMSHGPTLAGLLHQRDRAAKVVALGGYKYYANDALGGPSADVIMYYETRKNGQYALTFIPGHAPPQALVNEADLSLPSAKQPVGKYDHLAMYLASRSFAVMHQTVTLVNLPEFDMPLGHIDGADRDAPEVASLMRQFDGDLAALEDTYRRAGVLNQTLFVITADHGFVSINHHVPYDTIRNAVLKAGSPIIHGNYHSGAYLWLKDPSKAQQAASNVAALNGAYIQSVYYQAPDGSYVRVGPAGRVLLPGADAANHYLLQSFSGPNAPDVVVLFDEGAVGTQYGEANWKGDHGGADWQSQHIPLILSGPGVRGKHVSKYSAQLMDIAPTILSLLRTDHSPMRGIVLADALRHPSAVDTAMQQKEDPQVSAVVSALRTESSSETKHPAP